MVTEQQWALLEVLADQGRAGLLGTDEVLSAAHFVLGESAQGRLLEAALEVIDLPEETKYRPVKVVLHDSSPRKYWKVAGSRDSEYFCTERHCTCLFFSHAARGTVQPGQDLSGVILCKHLLAIRLATALRRVETVRLPLDRFLAAFEPREPSSFHPSFHTPHRK